MRYHNAVASQLDLVSQSRKNLDHLPGNGLGPPHIWTLFRQGLVSTHGPLLVTATVCSK